MPPCSLPQEDDAVPIMFRFLSLLLSALLLASCSGGGLFGGDKEEKKAPDPAAEQLYSEGMDYLNGQRYKKATETFQEIERLYPYSKWATRGQVMTAYAFFKEEEYDDAIGVVDQYVKLNPANKDTPYMFYLKALCYYDRISDIRRDQKITEEALNALNEVARRFPDSEFASDATLKVDLVQDHLAGKEMEIGRFYLKRKNYVGAINRFRKVVDQHQTTNHAAEALYRLVEAYLSLGMRDEAQKHAAVLGHNYPNSLWYKYAYRLVAGGANTPEPEEEPWYRKFILREEENVREEKLPAAHESNSLIDSITSVFD